MCFFWCIGIVFEEDLSHLNCHALVFHQLNCCDPHGIAPNLPLNSGDLFKKGFIRTKLRRVVAWP